jgi:hypothetical protein
MAWSRIESKFWQHPKFAGWRPAEKWALGELIGYCCEYRTQGVIPDDLALLPRSITPRLIAKAEDGGWIDVDEDGTKRIHDWHIYHPKDPTASERVLRHRRKQTRKHVNGETVTETPPTNTSTNTNPEPIPEPLAKDAGRAGNGDIGTVTGEASAILAAAKARA